MSKLFSVPEIATLRELAERDSQIVFHGINKSGSLAMATAMRDAYEVAGRSSASRRGQVV